MNAEALIGTVLGTCTLQKLIGQGGMGAVYLAQQSRPRRQVAVKVLLPMTPLNRNQLAAFLERFRRETDAAASLEHPNIMPVHEYGERDGLAYLVMPYIGGGTLRDLLEREGQLPLEKAVKFLDQLAAALDCAHDHGVIHRDVKPANMMITAEGRLLLTDFGLVKIIAEGQIPQMRLTGPGAPVGTPDYMSPEQVIGDEVDPRADLYSLGVILYQMVTGTTPFQGDSPMQIAAQHLQIPPPSPQMLRPDLPIAAEQVIMRALSKRPADRYARGQDLTQAFRAALASAGFQLSSNTASMPVIPPSTNTGRIFVPKSPFNAPNSTRVLPAVDKFPVAEQGTGQLNRLQGTGQFNQLQGTGVMPVIPPSAQQPGGGLLSRTGKFPMMGGTGQFKAAPKPAVAPQQGAGQFAATQLWNSTRQAEIPNSPFAPEKDVFGSSAKLPTTTGQQPVAKRSTGNLDGEKNTVKLTGPVKVVQVPVAGQPGKYVTGILPVPPASPQATSARRREQGPSKTLKWISFAIAAVLLIAVAGGVWLTRSQQTNKPTVTPVKGTVSPAQATAAQATAAAQANIIFQDPLDHNVNSWPVGNDGAASHDFKDGAYHIFVTSDKGGGAILTNFTDKPDQRIVYSLTMQEIKGNDGMANNTFGLVFRHNQKNGVTTFYSFEVENTKNGQYHFWKYDGSKQGPDAWKDLWHGPFADEYHMGQGDKAVNTFKIVLNKDSFTFNVNGKELTTVKDGSFTSGGMGMIVNLKDTEVAFKNLMITRS
jgi:serine/threonine protein kinase